MRNAASRYVRRSRWFIAAAIVASGALALSSGIAQGRVDPISTGPSVTAAMSQDAVAIVTGGGTVVVTEGTMNVVASFGINAKRPDGFAGGGPASGRVNYTEHANVGSRHLNAPVVLMEAFLSSSPTPNGTGGSAAMSADCTAPAECPSGFASAIVYVEDNSDSGANSDVFKIFFCTFSPFLPGPTFNGTGTLDLGDGTAQTGGLALVATLTATGLTVTIGGNAIPTLPKSDGWNNIE